MISSGEKTDAKEQLAKTPDLRMAVNRKQQVAFVWAKVHEIFIFNRVEVQTIPFFDSTNV